MFLVMLAKIIMMIKKNRFYLSSVEQEARFFVCNVMLLVMLLCLTNHHHKSMSSGHFYVHDRVNIINKQKTHYNSHLKKTKKQFYISCQDVKLFL